MLLCTNCFAQKQSTVLRGGGVSITADINWLWSLPLIARNQQSDARAFGMGTRMPLRQTLSPVSAQDSIIIFLGHNSKGNGPKRCAPRAALHARMLLYATLRHFQPRFWSSLSGGWVCIPHHYVMVMLTATTRSIVSMILNNSTKTVENSWLFWKTVNCFHKNS